jgi:hypothetical protein
MSWEAGLPTLVPKKFRKSERFLQYLQSLGQWIDENPQTSFDGLLGLVDIDLAPTQYLQYLADSIGLTLNQSLGSDDAQLRTQIRNAIDWYKIKGTYKAITIILYTVQLAASVYDLYTLDYKNFVRMNWFSLGVDNPLNFQVYPNTYQAGMYKSPHFDIQINLLNYFGTSPNWYLIQGNQFTIAQTLVEQVRPVNTVPHYYAEVVGSTTDNFLPNTIPSSQVSTVIVQNNWQTLTYTMDNNPLKYMDQGNVMDFTLNSFLNSWTVFQIGTGQVGVQPTTTRLSLDNPVFTGTVSNIVIGSNSATFTCDVPLAYVQSGITELGIFNNGGTAPTNLISDFNFTYWNNTTTPTYWLTSGGASVSQNSTTTYGATYSARVSNGGGLYQSLPTYASLQGSTVRFGAWVWSNVANSAYLDMYDGFTNQSSSFHPGDSKWHFLSVTALINASANQLVFNLIPGANQTAYFDLVTATDISGSGLQILVTNPAINKVNGYILEYNITINF